MGKWIQRWRTALVVAAAGAAGLVAQTIYRSTQDATWLVIAILLVIAGTATPVWFKHLDEKRDLTVLQKYQLQMNDGLEPLLQQLTKLCESRTFSEEKVKLGELTRVAIEAARHVAGQGRLRATYYRVQEPARGKPPYLEPAGHTGRGTSPQTVFRKGTPQGDHVFRILDRDEVIFVPDTATCDLPGWDVARARDYKTFVSVPVRGKQKTYGMLTVDGPEPGDLSDSDAMFIRCVGLLLAAGVAMVNHPQGPRETRRRQ